MHAAARPPGARVITVALMQTSHLELVQVLNSLTAWAVYHRHQPTRSSIEVLVETA